MLEFITDPVRIYRGISLTYERCCRDISLLISIYVKIFSATTVACFVVNSLPICTLIYEQELCVYEGTCKIRDM